ncbi:MAG: class I SAM-dependent methyltransferase [Planctomycetota bacterium]|jgi:ubiquinone/menaquinone biosynthesis C-methylase UbiE
MTKREFWDRYLRAYDGLNAFEDYEAYLDGLASCVCARPGESVLDAGSGTGNLSVKMRALGASVVSLDSSPVGLAIHREKDPSARLELASLESRLPFPDSMFDSVVCASVLFALSESGRRTALREFLRVLKPGGHLLVTVMRKKQSRLRFGCDLLRHSFQRCGPGHRPTGGLRPLIAFATILYYNLRLYGLKRSKGYRRFSEQEVLAEVSGAGFVRLRYDRTFGGRFHMVRARAQPHLPRAAVALPGPPNGEPSVEHRYLRAPSC